MVKYSMIFKNWFNLYLRSKLTRSTPKLSFDDRSFRQMEDGSKTVDSLGSKKHLRRISAFGVLEGPRTCSDISNGDIFLFLDHIFW